MNHQPPSKVQASNVTYELHSLGWKAFQHLCWSIASDVWGQTVQGFFDSKDGGRDGAFYGQWSSLRGEQLTGSFTIQCKFTAKPGKFLHKADLAVELPKAQRLASKGLSKNYFLFTNYQITGVEEEKVKAAFEAIPGISHFGVFGLERLSQFIRESSRLRMMVPRVYGLGDLSQILDERRIDQSKEILSSLGDDLQKFVITDAYKRSHQAILEHGMVVLLGEPQCGKSAIATVLALGALDVWGCSTFKIIDADDFVEHSNPHDAKQFFWIDDVFGATQMEWQSVARWNKAFPHLNAALKRGAKFVFTSRDYIYRNAKRHLKESSAPGLMNSQVVIKVEEISPQEREQILYNHIRLGTQDASFKKGVKPLLPAIAANKRFTPEIARRLGNPAFTNGLILSAGHLAQFVENAGNRLVEIIQTMDAASRSALALVFMRGGSLASPMTLVDGEQRAIGMIGGTQSDVIHALGALEGSFLTKVLEGGHWWWRFKHPSVRDAFASLVAQDSELMDIYLQGTPLQTLFSEVACGATDIEGVKVFVPIDRFTTVLQRISQVGKTGGERRMLLSFLAHRCGKEFLSIFLDRTPGFLSSLHVGAYFYAVVDISLISTLHACGLLPESERLRHIKTIQELAVSTPDAGFTRKEVRSLFTESEYEKLLSAIRVELIGNLSYCLRNWKYNYSHDEDPDDYYRELESALDEFKEIYSDDAEAVKLLERSLSSIADTKAETEWTNPDSTSYGASLGDGAGKHSDGGGWSIFDDVDE